MKRLPAELRTHTLPVEPAIPYGRFRGNMDVCQLNASNDFAAVLIWLAQHVDSANTLASYIKESDRLIRWANSLPTPVALSGLAVEDFVLYKRFLANPVPHERWVGPPLPRSHKNWKPFAWRRVKVIEDGIEKMQRVAGLSDASIVQAFDVIRSLYAFLHKSGYLVANPLATQKRRRSNKAQRKTIARYLDKETWKFLVDFIETLPRDTKRDEQHYRRVRWLFYLLYLSRARRSEVANGRMTQFYQDDTDHLWYWAVTGKGDKERDVPVSDELLDEFRSYRQFHGLPPEPFLNEETPLVLSVTGRSGLSSKSVYLIVKTVCQLAAERLRGMNPKKAEKLARATTHWLRHTSATHYVNDGGDLRVAQETLGHEDIRTTMIYQHVEKTDMHKASTKQRIRER